MKNSFFDKYIYIFEELKKTEPTQPNIGTWKKLTPYSTKTEVAQVSLVLLIRKFTELGGKKRLEKFCRMFRVKTSMLVH